MISDGRITYVYGGDVGLFLFYFGMNFRYLAFVHARSTISTYIVVASSFTR